MKEGKIYTGWCIQTTHRGVEKRDFFTTHFYLTLDAALSAKKAFEEKARLVSKPRQTSFTRVSPNLLMEITEVDPHLDQVQQCLLDEEFRFDPLIVEKPK